MKVMCPTKLLVCVCVFALDPNNTAKGYAGSPARYMTVMVKGQQIKLKWCPTCYIWRPPRASHCGLCNNCYGMSLLHLIFNIRISLLALAMQFFKFTLLCRSCCFLSDYVFSSSLDNNPLSWDWHPCSKMVLPSSILFTKKLGRIFFNHCL